MKFLLILPVQFLFLFTLSQSKTNQPKQQVAKRDINNVQGNQTIKNYNYYHIVNAQTKQKAIEATIGYFGKQKDADTTEPILVMGALAGVGTFYINNEPISPLKLKVINNQLNIYGNLRDSYGNMVATLNGRSWEINNKAGIDYNNDDSAFEIISGGRVIFQILLKKDTVFCNGLLCGEKGNCMYNVPIYPGDRKIFIGFEEKAKDATQRFDLPMDKILRPVFKYPRYEFLGVRENKQKLKN